MHTLTFEKIDWVNDKTLICGKNLSEGIKKHLKHCFFLISLFIYYLFLLKYVLLYIIIYLFIYSSFVDLNYRI